MPAADITGFRLSPQQQRLWSLQRGRYNPSYRAQCVVLIEGPLRPERLEAALRRVVARHDILRTTFASLPGMSLPVQVVADESRPSLGLRDFGGSRPAEAALDALYEEVGREDFDLARGPLLRLALAALAPERHALVVALPALCADAATLRVLCEELAREYAEPPPDASGGDDEALTYAGVSEWQNELLESEETEEGRAFWLQPSAPDAGEVKLPFEVGAAAGGEFDARALGLRLAGETAARIGEVSSRYGAAAPELLLACWGVLLCRLTGRDDVVVGVEREGRISEELERVLGPLAKHLPLRLGLAARAPFGEILRQVGAALAEAAEWQEYFSWAQYAEAGAAPAGLESFRACFAYERQPGAFAAGGVTFSVVRQYACAEPFGVKLSCVEAGGAIRLEFQFDARVFAEADVERLKGYFLTLLEGALENPEAPAGRLPILPEAERRRQLVEWNDTARDYPRDECLHTLFEAQAAATPDGVAVVCGDARLSYRELNQRANQVAHHLRGRGVGCDARVGVMMERSVEMAVALLGVLKAGAAYVPLDPEYPRERLAFMAEDAGVRILLTQAKFSDGLPRAGMAELALDRDRRLFETEGVENPARQTAAQNLAYVIYTSGSTGTPKGAMVTHQGALNCIRWMQQTYRLGEADAFLFRTSLNFDPSVWELFWPLQVGARVVVAPPQRLDVTRLLAYMAEQSVTCAYFVPSLLGVVVEEPLLLSEARGLRHVISGGEKLSPEVISRFYAATAASLHHSYGPTETSIAATEWACEPAGPHEPVLMGRPIGNTQVYVLDEGLEPVPTGAAGELYIGGAGVGRGYMRRAALTGERFIPDPFAGIEGSRLYRTGDVVRWHASGELEFLGRVDHQVKVRGHRIELGEIEAALLRHEGVRECAVTIMEEGGDKSLTAYIVGGEQAPLGEELREFLRRGLPEYMLPSAFVPLPRLPLTPSGKLDRRALPAPSASRPALSQPYLAPRTPREGLLASVWGEVLGRARVGVRDNFFDLGGDSILSLQVVARARREGLRLTPALVFQHPTVESLAEAVEAEAGAGVALEADARRGKAEQVEAEAGGEVPLTPIQHRFFALHPEAPRRFNQSVMLDLPGEADEAAMRSALAALVGRHDALRLRFEAGEGGRWRATVASPEEAARDELLIVHDLSGLDEAGREAALEEAAEEAQGSLDITAGPLLRAALLREGEVSRLLVAAHHLAVDGVSWRVLLEELRAAYERARRGEGPEHGGRSSSYAAWARSQAERARSAALRGELDYWLRVAGAEVGSLPVERPGGENTVGRARTIRRRLSARGTDALLRRAPEALRARAQEVMTAALARTLCRWAGVERLLVEVEGHGRGQGEGGGPDVTRTVGWFTSLYPVAVEARVGEGFAATLRRVKEELRRVPGGGEGYGLLRYTGGDEEVAGELGRARGAVLFNYLGQFGGGVGEGAAGWGGLRGGVGSEAEACVEREYEFEVTAAVVGGEMELEWRYGGLRYVAETVEGLVRRYVEELEALVERCETGAGGDGEALYSPSDFPMVNLDTRQLDNILNAVSFEEN